MALGLPHWKSNSWLGKTQGGFVSLDRYEARVPMYVHDSQGVCSPVDVEHKKHVVLL